MKFKERSCLLKIKMQDKAETTADIDQLLPATQAGSLDKKGYVSWSGPGQPLGI